MMDIERFFPKAVSRENQSTFYTVPHREREHADEFLHGSCDAPFLKRRENDFSIAVASKTVTQGKKKRPQALKIINFTVENQYESAARRGHRLAPILRKIH